MEHTADSGIKTGGKTHLIWPDLLKLLAIYAVIVIHSAAPYLTRYEAIGLHDWWAGNIYDSAARWCIPVFIMLSGFFLIEKYREETFWSFFARRFFRVLFPLIIWSFIYFLWRIYANKEELSLTSFVPMLFMEPVYYHLWYMYLVIELYLLAPIMGLYMKYSCCRHNWYYLALWFSVAVVLTFIESWFNIRTYISIGTENSIFKFAGYFALGWMLKDFEVRAVNKFLFFLLFALGLFITAYGTYHVTVMENNGQFNDIFYEYFSFSVFMMAVAIFIVAKSLRPLSFLNHLERGHKALGVIAATVPGIYLVHAMLIAVAKRGMLGFKFSPDMMDPFIGVPVFAFGIFLASLLVVLIIRFLPVIKYIVPAVLIVPALFAADIHASDGLKLIEKDEFKTLTRFAKTPLKKIPELKAWEKAVPQVSIISIKSTYDKTSQKALFYDSGTVRKKPLLIVLHSWSEDYRQSFGIPYGIFAVKNDWVFVQPDYRGKFTNPGATASEGAISDILDALEYAKRNSNIDTSRVYLAGFSGGGMAALVMAGKYPDKWAGVVSWGAVYDLVTWYGHTKRATVHDYAKQIAASCGGPPLPGTNAEKDCRERSPSEYLQNARGKIPVYIAVGLRDTFVPPSQSLLAFNDLADEKGRLSASEVEYISKEHELPADFKGVHEDKLFAEAGVPFLYERESNKAILKIYEGKHDVVYNAGLAWLSAQKR